jgi:CrcB protein
MGSTLIAIVADYTYQPAIAIGGVMSYLLIFVGSGLGGIFRYLLGTTLQKLAGAGIFPIGTFCVNLLGCFLIGFLAHLADSKGMFPREQRLFIFVGLLGGFTTFSSFGHETVQLIKDGYFLYASFNALFQVLFGLTCVWLGYVVGRLV